MKVVYRRAYRYENWMNPVIVDYLGKEQRCDGGGVVRHLLMIVVAMSIAIRSVRSMCSSDSMCSPADSIQAVAKAVAT